MNSQTDLETLKLSDKVVTTTINIFKIHSNYDQIVSYLKHSKEHKEQLALVKNAFQGTLRSLQRLEEKLNQDHTNPPCLKYYGK